MKDTIKFSDRLFTLENGNKVLSFFAIVLFVLLVYILLSMFNIV